ncbi:isocitrate lyase/PEP mutase family protein [Streptosporangium subroseum]|uniref:isocitrate lyase/PEP mutase family protein n=1 Tax=Streptosporangium subroseum TaxID=106412 RepID=UPI00308C98C9|nr:isocitrate lyase/phosphoenolpyruvate mutase family protein [Streptosporangium subroseum]
MSGTTSRERYEAFAALHEQNNVFVMPNAFDGLSAAVFAEAGFKAVATSSAAFAATLGRLDGRHAISRDEHLAHAQLLSRASKLPVNGDFEDGYGDTPDDVAATVKAAIAAGLSGIGIEDTSADPDHPIRDFDEAVERVRHAATAARGQIVLTGRTDNFIQGRPDLDDTIRRLTAFAEAGADVLFAPYLPDLDAVATVVNAVAPKPVNVLLAWSSGDFTLGDIQRAGARRISLGVDPYLHSLSALRTAAGKLAGGDLAALPTTMGLELLHAL